MSSGRAKIGQYLIKMKVLNADQLREALRFQQSEKCRLGDALVKLGYADEKVIQQALAHQYKLKFVDLEAISIPDEVIASVPRETLLEHTIVPVKRTPGYIIIAMCDPLDYFVLDNLRFVLNTDVKTVLSTRSSILAALGVEDDGAEPGKAAADGDNLDEDDVSVRALGDDADGKGADDAPVIRLVQQIIANAVKMRASDIHVEPFEKELRVRYRVDGVCVKQESPPKRLQGPIISRLKIMSRMQMEEKRRPQDGRIKAKVVGKDLDFRVSALPTSWGESVVLRILDRVASLVSLDKLGFHESDYNRFRGIIKRPNGIFLVTGPTGSGKTTTLYAALQEINRPDVKIITAEDPIEYHLAGINQSQVNEKIGLTFSRIIRAMLRQAPNIILVGEIRDKVTADTAIQAALTGHLVFSTLHTNDAPSALSRMIDLGVKPFLVSSAVLSIMGQRLVRLLCTKCREPYNPETSELMSVGLTEDQAKDATFYRSVGCPECNFSGYHGRKGIFELMRMNTELRELTFKKAPTNEIRNVARQHGMVTLQEDGIRKILSGESSVDEILRVTQRDELI
ncbi:MAG: GspE/PulE family protein [Planctomycetota bacterium]|jgi:type IV pilus assembly protein PilB